MKKSLKIMRVELSNLFYSPVAWMLLIIFLIQCSLTFSDSVQYFLSLTKLAKLLPTRQFQGTTEIITSVRTGLFGKMISTLYLYLPLLTMGLISRELNSGTIRLLYSSPIKTREIVFGKFMAMVAYNLLLVLILGMYLVVSATSVIYQADIAMMLSALLGVFLLLCAYAAIGLFMSCLTSYQVVAALSTLAVFATLQYMGKLGQDIDLIRDLTYYLSLSSRIDTLFLGLINTRDILYFIAIIVLFLGFSMLRLQSDQEYRPLWQRASRYMALFMLTLGFIYLSSRPQFIAYRDVTAPQSNTISTSTQELIKSTGNEPLEVTAYVNLIDDRFDKGRPQARNAYLGTWEKYTRFKPGMKFNYVYYYDTTSTSASMMRSYYKDMSLKEIATDYAKTNDVSLDQFLTPERARMIPGLRDENGRMVMQLSYKGHKTFIRMFDDMEIWPGEPTISAAISRLMAPGSVPTVGFLQGELERITTGTGERNYTSATTEKTMRASLLNNGFDIATIPDGQDIPKGLSVLVIADPKTAFSVQKMEQLRKYIDEGGNLLITGEPGKQEVLNPLLKLLGVAFRKGILVEQNKDNDVPDKIRPYLTEMAANMSQATASLYFKQQPLLLPGAMALDLPKTNLPDSTQLTGGNARFKIDPLLFTNSKVSWLKMGKLVSDSATVNFIDQDGDEHGAFFPAVGLTRKLKGRTQCIAVVGDADFLSNESLFLPERSSNSSLIKGLFKWFSGGAFPVEPSKIQPKDLKLVITDNQLTVTKIILLWVLPGLLLAGGTILLIRRRRK